MVLSRCGRSEISTDPRDAEEATSGRARKSVAAWRLIR
jgi:hypothetical protein